MNIRVVCIGSIFTLCLLPVVLFAHSLGQSLEKQVGEYFIDIGYSSPVVTLQAGESVRFDFNLWSKDHTQAIDFATVWVRIAPAESGITFAGYLGFPEFGPLGMSYAFPDEGSYVLTARYFDGADMLGEASFPLTVLGEKFLISSSLCNLSLVSEVSTFSIIL